MINNPILLVAFFISIAASNNIYHIVPDNTSGDDTSSNTHTLQYYVDNYNFTCNTKLLFQRGQHYLNTTMLVRGVQNITMIGENTCSITCAESVWIIVVNVTNFRLESIINFKFVIEPNNSRIKTNQTFRFKDLFYITYNLSIVLYKLSVHQW